jgi:TatD DNase family protein
LVLIDSHCHLADDAFAQDLDEVVARARGAGLSTALCVLAMDEPDEAARAPRVAALWPSIRFALGIHPHQAGRFAGPLDQAISAVRGALEATPGIRAVGEIGLDYHYDLSPRDVQREVFRAQVVLAGEMQLPVVVHTREAEADTMAILEDAARKPLAGVLHCFTGTAQLARWALDAGLYVSFAGIVTFPNARALREVAGSVPLDRLLVETDCPYLAPVPFRGSRNEPAHVIEVARALAEVHDVPLEEIARSVTRNFHRLFGEVPDPT